MKNRIFKIGTLVIILCSVGMGGFYLWKIKRSVEGLTTLPQLYTEKKVAVLESHSSKIPTAGGHGEAAPAGGHGEAAPAGGHGEAANRSPGSESNQTKGTPLFSVDELYVNVRSETGAHMMGLKLELELFEVSQIALLKSRHSGVRDRVIELSRDFEYAKLNTLGGKLYFKETIVGTLNEFFGQAIVKNAHISSFYLQ
ncbi:MAG: flagellar basal body-associated FliL family protein [Deltaproteobacteria bacterium]|nr:flagellar basal body-associated FliL family protein [Deltaproteobacteria bacterium]